MKAFRGKVASSLRVPAALKLATHHNKTRRTWNIVVKESFQAELVIQKTTALCNKGKPGALSSLCLTQTSHAQRRSHNRVHRSKKLFKESHQHQKNSQC
eukprot:1073470-Pleurochrysis_carterae.AAC.1